MEPIFHSEPADWLKKDFNTNEILNSRCKKSSEGPYIYVYQTFLDIIGAEEFQNGFYRLEKQFRQKNKDISERDYVKEPVYSKLSLEFLLDVQDYELFFKDVIKKCTEPHKDYHTVFLQINNTSSCNKVIEIFHHLAKKHSDLETEFIFMFLDV